MYSAKSLLAEVSSFSQSGLEDPLTQLNHLLKVADSVSLDAAKVWSELWNELQPYATPAGSIPGDLKSGFVPACGWPEFLEKFFLLKHYIDSARRICQKKS